MAQHGKIIHDKCNNQNKKIGILTTHHMKDEEYEAKVKNLPS